MPRVTGAQRYITRKLLPAMPFFITEVRHNMCSNGARLAELRPRWV